MKKTINLIYQTDLKYVLVALAIVIVSNSLLIFNFVVGISMVPTLKEGNFVVSNRLARTFGRIEQGDLVIASVGPEGTLVIKRVIGVPGDIISYNDGIFVVNGEELVERYVIDNPSERINDYKNTHWTLKDDEYFIVGDNRNFSHDSRMYGPVYINRIKGKVLFFLGV